MTDHLDVLVVGGGIVGLATAYRILERCPDHRVRVLERAAQVGTGQSARNSGVLHAGIYYPPGSAKARWCRAGKLQLERFCAQHGVPVQRTGKVVVAVDRAELPRLRELAARARSNAVELDELGPAGLADREPHVTGLAAIWTPETAVTDFRAVCDALAAEVTARGGEVVTGVEVTGIAGGAVDTPGVGTSTTAGTGAVVVDTGAGPVRAGSVVVCAGLQADRLAAAAGAPTVERIVPFRGAWLELRPGLGHLVRGNIYPVPQPGLPFLGVHLTRRIDGRIWIGPNAVLATAREGARPFSVDRRDLAAVVGFPGTWRLARTHLATGLGELWRDRVIAATITEVQRYVPAIGRRDVRRGPWGVRAQLVAPDGTLVDDFQLRATHAGRVHHVLNAPSPAATSALAIGDALAERVTPGTQTTG